MLLLPTFDPNNPVSGQFNLNLTGGYGKAVIYNESNSNLKFTFSNGYTSYVPAWVAVEYCFLDIPLTNPIVKYSTVSTVVTGTSSISQVAIEIYEASEKVGGTYPAALIRQVSADVTSSSTTSLQNDGNAANTVYLEATQSGGPASNVSGTVDGSIQFNQWDGVTKKLLLQTIANAAANNPSVKALAAGMFMEIVGSLLIDQNLIIANNQAQQWKDNGGVARRVLQVDNNNNTQLFGVTGLDLVQMLSSAGSLAFIFDLINKSLDIKTTPVIVNGTTTGTATIYQFLTGTNVKAMLLQFNNYRNASVTSQNIAIPVPFTTWALWFAGNGAFITPRNGGSNLVNMVRVITALAVGGGTNAAASLLPPKAIGEIIQAFDGFDLGNSQGTGNTSFYGFVGQ